MWFSSTGVAAVAGVFLLLGLGMVLGLLILIFEHWFFKFMLPHLRVKPKDSIWRSRNIMFFSQKLYRFINCVELVSPHHAARELVNTLRQGQIASLFQKSIKRVCFLFDFCLHVVFLCKCLWKSFSSFKIAPFLWLEVNCNNVDLSGPFQDSEGIK